MAAPENNVHSNGISGSNGYINGDTNGHQNGVTALDGKGQGTYEPIAIIGMGMRLPGGVHNAESYWDLLVNGREGRCRVPKDRYNIDTWFGPGRVTHVGTQYAHFLEELNLANIDPNFWSFTKQEAELLDPQQRLFLEVVYEALENSGKTGWRGKDIGVYVGALGDDWGEMEMQDGQDLNPTRTYVYGDYIIANRASYEFDLKGPRYEHAICTMPLTYTELAWWFAQRALRLSWRSISHAKTSTAATARTALLWAASTSLSHPEPPWP